MKTFISFALILLFIVSQPASSAGAGDESTVSRLIQRLDTLRRQANIPGLSAAVIRNQELVFATGLGYADIETRRPATAETLYNIASVTKPISAVVALRLAEQGKLDLDRSMVEYSQWRDFCTEFSIQPSIFAKNLECTTGGHTLRHLLSHTATKIPGTRFSYNPVLYSWASRPIMAAAGQPFSTLVRQYIFTPANMQQSARINRDLPLRAELQSLLAPPHRTTATGSIEHAPPLPAQGDGAAGGVITNVLDLAKFDIALDQGKLISQDSVAKMMTPTPSTPTQSTADTDLPYGLGWFIQEYRGQRLVWHSGWWENAYSALYLKIPQRQLSFILLANSEGVWWGNPLDQAAVHQSAFAQAFLETMVENTGDSHRSADK